MMITLLKYIGLFLIATFLGWFLIPFGILVAIIYFLIRLDGKMIHKYFGRLFYNTALCIDMIGNYSCAILFNLTLIKKNERAYRFGKERETISYALGKNVMANNLTWLGRMLNKILDFFEKDHSILTVHREGTLN